MFIDQEWKKQKEDFAPASIEDEIAVRAKKRKMIFFAWFIFVFSVAFVLILMFFLNSQKKLDISLSTGVNHNEKKGTSTVAVLPDDFGGNGDGLRNGGDTSGLRAEEMQFGSFYEKPESYSATNTSRFDLPINIKSDVLNYYDVSRKVDIENKIQELNDNGFSMLDAQYDSNTSDFFTMYRSLFDSQVPLFISSDFISYYYQNNLKETYKDIEKNVFYDSLWNINKQLYDISLAQYRNIYDKTGTINDPVLEGERLKTVFLAISLKLLKPKEDQINTNQNFTDENKFTAEESGAYYFDIPNDLKAEVEKEVSLIDGARGVAKSPVFLYEKDYAVFKVPDDYLSNAKLRNYYLAKKWMNSFFPLFYKSEECPECLLDYNDWLNNFAAASFLAEDLKNNQELKNQWALIYKFISFFEGLKSDLTYLHFNNAYTQAFPGGYSVQAIFSNDNQTRKENLADLQNIIIKNKFLPIEGGTQIHDKKDMGMRLLQDNYWPSDYIFKQLTGTEISSTESGSKTKYTACSGGENNPAYRCVGFSGDILSLMSVFPENEKYYQENIDYLNYKERIAGLQDQLGRFDKFNWNSNMYWMNFDLYSGYSAWSKENLGLIYRNSRWMDKKMVNSILGSWVNVGLPSDKWENYQDAKAGNLSFSAGCDLLSFIEPSVQFYSDLIKRNNMLLKAIEVLRVGSNINAASIAINEMNKNLNFVKSIAEIELNGGGLNEEGCQTMKEFVSGTKVKRAGIKELVIKQAQKGLKENISGVKLLAYIYSTKFGEKIMVVGPVFNFKEQIK
jgi:hypothetical protein